MSETRCDDVDINDFEVDMSNLGYDVVFRNRHALSLVEYLMLFGRIACFSGKPCQLGLTHCYECNCINTLWDFKDT